MSELYEKGAFESLGLRLQNLEPPEETTVTQTEIVSSHFAEIDGALERGIPIDQVYELMVEMGLGIQLSTFKTTLAKVRKGKKLEQARLRREAKQKAKAEVALQEDEGRCDPEVASERAKTKRRDSAPARREVDPTTVQIPPPLVHAEVVKD